MREIGYRPSLVALRNTDQVGDLLGETLDAQPGVEE
jgi:hypothetical protein